MVKIISVREKAREPAKEPESPASYGGPLHLHEGISTSSQGCDHKWVDMGVRNFTDETGYYCRRCFQPQPVSKEPMKEPVHSGHENPIPRVTATVTVEQLLSELHCEPKKDSSIL